MDERLRYPFKHNAETASNDVATFNLWMTGRISTAHAIASISRHNGVRMTPEQFEYYVNALGYGRKRKNDE